MLRRILASALVTGVVLTGGTAPAGADSAQPAVVSTDPVDWTPHVLDGTVWSMAVVGDTVIVGGDFTKVADSRRRHTYRRKNIFAFDLHDGAIRAFDPALDGTVYALAAGPHQTVYVGGAFTQVNGDGERGLARLDLDGDRVSGFHAAINWGDVRALAARDGWVYAGGTFSAINGDTKAGLARLDTSSGDVDDDFDARLTAPGLRRTFVESLDVSPDGRRLVAVGSLMRSAGVSRPQIAMFDIGSDEVSLSSWYTDAYAPPCAPDFEVYARQVKFSPDGTYLVVVSTGGTSDPSKLCDGAARFNTAGAGNHPPVWVQHTGGNSLTAVAITGPAVYLGGHQLYMDNPLGHKTKDPGKPPVYRPGPGAVVRPGIGAVSPATGKTLAWNPTRSRGVGVHVFVTVPDGLLVGSDTDELGHEYHGRIGMFPLP